MTVKPTWAERVLGVTWLTFATEIGVRVGMVAYMAYIGISAKKMVEIDPELLYKYSYPTLGTREQTVPMLFLGIGIVALAVLLFGVTHGILKFVGRKIDASVDGFHYIMAFTMTSLSTFVLVQSMKLWVTRPRPDFLARCYPEGLPDVWERIPTCTRDLTEFVINDGIQSFPSGHSASAWMISIFCFLYLREQLKSLSCHTPSRIPRGLPFLMGLALATFATYVSCSRLWDFQHHPEDVVAGGLIGVFCTYFSFHLYYPLATQRRASDVKFDEETESLMAVV